MALKIATKKHVSPKKNNSKSDEILKRFLKAQDRLVYQTSDLSLASLSSMTSKGDGTRAAIDLEPDFQRRERWPVQKQSALIESFLLNVPVPPVYLAEDEFGQYSVVDGKQRLSAIHAFMVDKLKLKGLETFTELEGLALPDLPDDLRNALSIRPYVRVVTLLKQSDPTLKFEVFTRLNRGGEPMLPQELRKVAYRGPFSNLIYELAKSPFLRSQLKISSNQSPAYIRMEDAEFVLRFFALRDTWKTFSGGLRNELDECMVRGKGMTPQKVASHKTEFQTSLAACEAIWGEKAFQRHTGQAWRSQFLAGMYDAEMLSVAELSPSELQNAKQKSKLAILRTSKLFQTSDFERYVRQGTNTPSFVRGRVEALIKLLRGL